MTADTPFNKFLDEVRVMLAIAQSGKKISSTDLPKELLLKLDNLEAMVTKLNAVGEDAVKRMGVSDTEIQEILSSLEQLPLFDRRQLEKLKTVKQEVDAIKATTSKQAAAAKQKEKSLGKEGKAVQARKKRFDRMGRRKDWKPL